ncbi:hypothetical protein PC116_g18374 [Phytophthora cactorum]|uniref:Uncharacterized protein n=1 Tax=Phytophthora cactorum TaxID=29920 RepID=A0A8T1KCM1_9STRA|nr:hypothetical protein PC117_g22826 [Phytophthora cactorum]KAG2963818.1 hypothetical protein PC118_g20684 [Phytophthora cactorum]KAG3006157.1 hypothetical protein PC120_g17549 [Phytophthora cactorum]KAG3131271.1 hypothetical protein C6341_g23402 [Phytophthora cactorum]KAG4233422.1 hypothetical protein PC116_g18374 [Phytophthora cactorum]
MEVSVLDMLTVVVPAHVEPHGIKTGSSSGNTFAERGSTFFQSTFGMFTGWICVSSAGPTISSKDLTDS